jgi:hypothetical protein
MKSIALLAAVASLALVSTADARSAKAKFRVSLDGVQTTTWSEDAVVGSGSGPGCDIRRKGTGSERVTFATSSPITARMERRRYHGKPIPRIRFASGDEAFKVAATIDRRADVQPDTDSCTGETSPSGQSPDCGTRTADWWIFVAPVYLHRDHVWVGSDYRKSQDDPFQSCEHFGPGFPEMSQFRDIPGTDGRRELIDAPLSTRKLFDRHVKHLSVTGHGSLTDADDTPEVHSLTELTWHVTFERLK